MKVMVKISQIDVSFSCVCPVIDHDIVKVAVDPRGDSRGQTHEKLTSFCFLQ